MIAISLSFQYFHFVRDLHSYVRKHTWMRINLTKGFWNSVNKKEYQLQMQKERGKLLLDALSKFLNVQHKLVASSVSTYRRLVYVSHNSFEYKDKILSHIWRTM